jgi:N-acetylmuramoyl-L-alanine amidase
MTPIQWFGSPNFSRGRRGYRPEAIVVHIIEGSLSAADSTFNARNPGTDDGPVSAHYGVGNQGQVHQYVDEMDSAWHAGTVDEPSWRLLKPGVNPNRYTVGIEHEGNRHSPWTPAMYEASAGLIAAISKRWVIPLDRLHVVGHHEIRASKSFCPGFVVDLDRLIDLARQHVLGAESVIPVVEAGTVTTTRPLNIRQGAPSTSAILMSTAPKGTPLAYTAWTSTGENVQGNPHWYRDADGNYFWAGATDAPMSG